MLWLHLFILSGVISPLISSSILGPYRPGEFIFQCPIFLPFHSVYGVLKAGIGEGNGTPLQYSRLENPMDGGAWWAAVHGVATSWIGLSDFTFTFHFHALEKEMATHPSVLAWRIPGTGESGGLPPMGSHRVGHDSSDLAAAAACYMVGPWCLSILYVIVCHC